MILVAGALLVAGCGGSGAAGHADRDASLVLDFTPNPVHVGIYTALAHHDDIAAGIHLHVIVPGASTDSISLLEKGRVNFAILDIHDLAIAREHGQDIVGILPIVERPLAAVLAQPAVTDPRQLDGRTVGVTGAPSDTAVLDSIVSGAGGRPSAVHTLTIGFNAVSDLLAGRVAGATAFWNDEGVTLDQARPGFHDFRVEDYGAPSYPELVVCTTAHALRSDPGLARSVVDTLVRGYDAALADPRLGQRSLESQVPALNHHLDSAELAALAPAFTGPERQFGVLDTALLRRWAAWEAKFGIVRAVPDVSATFDTAFAPR
ncbi:MAG TPA: ABC transporter substrate-binding protein [Solirubrobacteraceae bacterium]|jgi:ABC-type nitrate/sulfonate/bicarbonate transport system substrate-binding protein|nr:ABC transporter substrate-binding protein [Solirubrobacteraceae bacterium]